MTNPPHTHTVPFRDADQQLSAALEALGAALHDKHNTVRDLLVLFGEHGLLLGCLFLAAPFLAPVSIPGVSVLFGSLGIFLAVAVILDRAPWLPNRLLDHTLSAERLQTVVRHAAALARRLDRRCHPRWLWLTEGRAHRLNGVGLLIGNLFLLFPLGVAPFTNTLPGWAIVLLAVGMLQRDGVWVLLGYLLLLATLIYFGALALAVVTTGQGVLGLLPPR